MSAVNPPQDCGICGEDLKSGPTFFDAAIPTYPYFGLWAWACSRCAEEHHVRVGTGCGQEYDSKTNEKLRG